MIHTVEQIAHNRFDIDLAREVANESRHAFHDGTGFVTTVRMIDKLIAEIEARHETVW